MVKANKSKGPARPSKKMYVEGGGDRADLKTDCRRAFSIFLEKAGLSGNMPRIFACGGRQSAYESFVYECSQASAQDKIYLLVDSEDPVTVTDPWTHVANRPGDGWTCPNNAGPDQLHLMVQMMEHWFLADPEGLATFFGGKFQHSALPAQPTLEDISKHEVLRALTHATRACHKGSYSKGGHSFKILESIDPAKVASASPWAARL